MAVATTPRIVTGPFAVPSNDPRPWAAAARRLTSRPLARVLALDEFNRTYECASEISRDGGDTDFVERALESLDVTIRVPADDLARIPSTGPLLVVANHPFGGADGLALLALLRRVRRDVKLFANRFLGVIPELRDALILVDPFGSPAATPQNTAPVAAAVRHLRAGGALAVFPAGEVSSIDPRRGTVTDPPWNTTAARLATKAGAAVLPVHFPGRNSLLFNAAGLLHPRLRTLLLPRELLARRGQSVHVTVGSVIPPQKLARFNSAEDLTAYLRARTYLLSGRARPTSPSRRRTTAPPQQSLIATIDPALVGAEVSSLPPTSALAASGPLAVHLARTDEIPHTLREIGRLRELTFRRVGEGTGKSLDLDRFDAHYLHLFVYHAERREIVGGYRLAPVDETVARHGPAGLYTSTLFRYQAPLLDQLADAIELGRSFVRPEYQREYAPLLLLWKGIGRFVAMNAPRYRCLFGPVSISNTYTSLTKRLLVAFLRMNRSLPNLGRLVEPRHAPRFARADAWADALATTAVRDADEVDELVAEIEHDRLTMPVLLRQYLKLNAKLLGFNTDPAFGNVLDALMLVDLTQVSRAVLARYMGREGAEQFLRHHAA
jgi:putative hemolysin